MLPQRLQSVLAVFSVGASVSLFIVRQNDFDNNRVRAYIEARYPAFRYRRDVRIYPAPGWTLHRICVWIFSPRTVVEILEPSLSDMQVEFWAALKEGRTAKARWVQIRGYWNFWTTLVMQIPASATRALLSYWRGV